MYDDHMYCEECKPPHQKHMIDCWCIHSKDDAWSESQQCMNSEHALFENTKLLIFDN